jgi:hypothetical protein
MTPQSPPRALRAPRRYLADTPALAGAGGPGSLCWPGGMTPRSPPRALRAPRRYLADTPALAGAGGPGSLAGHDRLAVACRAPGPALLAVW